MKPKFLNPKKARALLDAATDIASNAYAPFSQLQVGAIVLTSDGRTFGGVNVENSSFGLTICAERAALFTAIASGERAFTAVAVSCLPARMCAPCGACRQVIFQLAPTSVVVWEVGDEVIQWPISDLLPSAFSMVPK